MAPAPPPDLVGYTVDEAREILAAHGWQEGEIVETRPPRRQLSGPGRVVRQREGEAGRVALVVCGERAEGARV
jgi:beta-lactam-binding protein with PASTA domain